MTPSSVTESGDDRPDANMSRSENESPVGEVEPEALKGSVPEAWTLSHDPVPARRTLRSGMAIALMASLVGGLVGAGTVAAIKEDGGSEVRSTASAGKTVQAANSSSIRELLNEVEPAVVSIQTRAAILEEGSAGTGMILTPDGEVLTNAHVVQGATSISVTLSQEKKSRRADVLGFDSEADVALLKIRDAKDLPTVKLGSSSDLQVGDSVVAIGNALALSGGLSVTQGIVSAKDRSLEDSDIQLSNLIQTDAAINQGNSGGPLLNMKGEVIGVNTAGFSALSAQNISFAIAIDTVKPMLDELRNGSLVNTEAWLGISAVTLDANLAEVLTVPVDEGAAIQNVMPGSPADDLGLTRGDVVVEFAGEEITSSSQMSEVVRDHEPGDEVEVTWYRGEAKHTEKVRLGQRPVE